MGLFTTTSCSSSDDEKKNDNEVSIQDSEYDAIINQYVDAVVLPTYNDLKAKNTALYNSVVAFGNNPSDANFQAVCNAWLTAREPWESSEAFLFGPVADYGLDPNMDSWPLDQEAIVNLLQSQQWNEMEWTGDYDEDDEAIAAAQNVRGFHTLEFLAFKNGKARTLTDTAEDGEAANAVYNESNATAWAQYMRNTAQLLVDDVTLLCDSWNNGYATSFKSHNGGDFTSGLSCIEQIIDGCIDIAGEVGDAKIGEPYDLYVSGKTTEALYAVESWYSWHSRDDYTNNIYSIRNAYYGSRDGSINTNSISTLMKKYNADLDTKVKNAIANAASAIQAIPQPFRNNINSREAATAMEACSALSDVLENELKPFLTNHTK
ncbi:MAG: peptidase M75 [Prevotella sp.]|nr:peptidase M75 [Prevotella sp.]